MAPVTESWFRPDAGRGDLQTRHPPIRQGLPQPADRRVPAQGIPVTPSLIEDPPFSDPPGNESAQFGQHLLSAIEIAIRTPPQWWA